jgi:hypothetical protein
LQHSLRGKVKMYVLPDPIPSSRTKGSDVSAFDLA